MDIEQLIGETTEYDKKQAVELKRPKSWCKSISAFANGTGGCMLFGIDNDGVIIGIDNPETDAEKMSEIIKTHLDPVPQFILRFEKINEKTIIVLDVMPGKDTPYYYCADGVLEAYTRIGNESVKLSALEQKRLIMKSENSSYDTQVSPYKATDFAFTKLHERYKRWTNRSFENKDMLSFGLVTDEGYLTNAGALLADMCPIRWSRIFCTRWNGLDKSSGTIDALDDAEFSGGLIYLLENGEEFIKRNCKKMWQKTKNSRVEMPEYVERSYHEALINALVHRDYYVSGSEVHIDIFDNRMEIYSPGGMFDGIDIQNRDLFSVPSVRRNPLIADVFDRLGYMERKGSGFGKIIDAYRHQVNYTDDKQPIFRSDRSNFFVIMPNLNYDSQEKIFGTQDVNIGTQENAACTPNKDKCGTQRQLNGTQGGTQGVAQSVTQKTSSSIQATETTPKTAKINKAQDKLLQLISKNAKITTEKMASAMGVSVRTIKRRISEMPNIEYVGSGYSGHWKINTDAHKK